MLEEFKNDNRGQASGLALLFTGLVVYLALTIAWINIANELITNYVAPVLSTVPYGNIGIILLYVAAYLLWFVIPIVLVTAALEGRRQQV